MGCPPRPHDRRAGPRHLRPAAFARQNSTYAQAFVWTAVTESIVLLIPSSAVAAAWTALTDPQRAVLDVLLGLHVTVVDPLDGDRARDVGQLGGDPTIAHVIACARGRGWGSSPQSQAATPTTT